MTIEEMDNVIQDYCEDRWCKKCAIEGLCDMCCGDFISNDALCEEAYDIIMGIPKETPEEETKPSGVTLATAVEKVVTDMINHPSHYTSHGMECIDEMILIFGREATANFCLLNAWKYRKRALYKNGQEDMDKSDWYIAKYEELKENEQLY